MNEPYGLEYRPLPTSGRGRYAPSERSMQATLAHFVHDGRRSALVVGAKATQQGAFTNARDAVGLKDKVAIRRRGDTLWLVRKDDPWKEDGDG